MRRGDCPLSRHGVYLPYWLRSFSESLISANFRPTLASEEVVSDDARHFLIAWSYRLSSFFLTILLCAVIAAGATAKARAQDPGRDSATTSIEAPPPCIDEATFFPSVEQQLCLSDHIRGFGGYNFEGPCQATVYLSFPAKPIILPDLLQPNIAAASPECGDDLTISIQASDYSYAELNLWGEQAFGILEGEETMQRTIADAMLGPFVLDNRVTIFLDLESFFGPAAQAEENLAQFVAKLSSSGLDLNAFRITSDPFSSRALAWNLLGVSDPCVPLNSALAVCMNDAQVQASLVDGTPTGVLGTARLRSRQDIQYTFMISWADDVTLEEYACQQEKEMEFELSHSTALTVGGFEALRFDISELPTKDSLEDQSGLNPDLPKPRMVLFVDTGAGIMTIVGMPMKPEVPLQDLYSGAERVAGIFRISH